MGNWRRTAGVLALVSVTACLATVPAASATVGRRVGPKQYFTGVVNGTDGNTTTPIPVEMACGGPGTGRTGHPVSGQTLAVHQLFPPSTAGAGTLGYTGDDAQIEAFFNAPPPAGTGARGQVKTPVFVRYDKPQPLSTKLTLPCSGTGTIYFSPVPVTPPSETASVPVQFDSQP
jgi:hypothetical protein